MRRRGYHVLRKKWKIQENVAVERCWDELPDGPLIEIAERLSIFEDFQALPLVCRRWHSVLRSSHCKFLNSGHVGHGTREVPWLMMANQEALSLRPCSAKGTTELRLFFYRLSFDRVRQMVIRLPPQLHLDQGNFDDSSFMSSRGWFFVVTKGLSMSLYNPLCGPTHNNYIPLPRNDTLATRGTRFTLSACPCTNSYTVMLACRSEFAFWRPGNEGWTFTEPPAHCLSLQYYLIDVTFYEGHYYALDNLGGIHRTSSYSLDNANREDVEARKTSQWSHVTTLNPKHIDSFLWRAYFVVDESARELLVVVRVALRSRIHIFMETKFDYLTAGFRVFSIINWGVLNVIEVKKLGNISMFVGRNDAFAVQVPKERNNVNPSYYGCKPNCIYFTDDRLLSRPITGKCVKGKDMGVYNMADGSIDRDFQGLSLDDYSPMLWV